MASDPTNVTTPLAQVAAAAPTRVAGQMVPLSVDENGFLRVALGASASIDIGDVTTLTGSLTSLESALPAGTNNIGDVDVASLPTGSLAGITAASAITTAQVSGIDDDPAVQIVASNASRKFLEIANNTPISVLYIGASGVTATTGHRLGPGESFRVEAPVVTAAFFGITATGSAAVTATLIEW